MARARVEVAKIQIRAGAQLRQAQCAADTSGVGGTSNACWSEEQSVVTIQMVAIDTANIQEYCWSASWNYTMEDA